MTLKQRFDEHGQPLSPDEITRTLIRQSAVLYDDLSNYCCEVVKQLGVDAIRSLPVGLQRVWRVTYLDTVLENGGFWSYFGARTDDEGNMFDVEEAIAAVHALSGHEIAEVIEEACAVWRQFISSTPAPPQTTPEAIRRYGEQLKPVGIALEPYYRRYSDLRLDFFKQIESYARAHEEEFLHSFDDGARATPATS